MDIPKVAIIIPNFNKQPYLEDCLNSVLNQSYKNIEIIIIDDHSTDASKKTIRSFEEKHKNIKAIFLTKNQGVSHARNYGASKTDADFITFLDSDDKYENKDKILNEVKFASNDSIVFSQWIPMEKDGKILPYTTFRFNPYRFFAICRILSVCLPPYKQLRGYLIPKALFDKIGGYDTSLNYYEDFDFQCRLCLNAKIKYTGSIGEAYRLNTGGLSDREIKDANKAIKNIQSRHYKNLNALQKIVFSLLNKY